MQKTANNATFQTISDEIFDIRHFATPLLIGESSPIFADDLKIYLLVLFFFYYL